jgi:hypothetical protein
MERSQSRIRVGLTTGRDQGEHPRSHHSNQASLHRNHLLNPRAGTGTTWSVYRHESFEDQIFTVVGDKHRAEIVDAGGTVVMTAVAKGLAAKIEYTDADGTLAGTLKANAISSKKRLEFTLADGTEWAVIQSGALRQIYSVLEVDGPHKRCPAAGAG